MGRYRERAVADAAVLRNSVDGAELNAYIERVEGVNDQIAEWTANRKEIFIEVKAAGYDTATVRAIVKRRAMDPEKRHSIEALMDEYMAALGDFATTQLGRAGADRVREAAE